MNFPKFRDIVSSVSNTVSSAKSSITEFDSMAAVIVSKDTVKAVPRIVGAHWNVAAGYYRTLKANRASRPQVIKTESRVCKRVKDGFSSTCIERKMSDPCGVCGVRVVDAE